MKWPEISGRRVLVTGAAGFIGAALTRRLVADLGCTVVGVDNERSGDWDRLDVSIEKHHRAIEAFSVGDWTELLADVDLVFHLAAEKYNSPGSTPERVLETNVAATHRLVQGAGAAQVAKVVFTSSLYAYGSLGPEPMVESDPLLPTTMYGASKAMGEHLLSVAARETGLRSSVGRLFFIYGPGQYADGGYKSVIISNFERLARSEAPTIYGDGQQALDYVYIDDCVDAVLDLAHPRADGSILNVGTGAAVTIRELTDAMLRVAGSELAPVYLPPDWTAGSVRAGDSGFIEQQLGWKASTPLEQGLGAVWAWLVEQRALTQ